MIGGHVNECVDCAKDRIKKSSRNIKRNCLICGKEFGTCISEINRGGGLTCSRDCYFKRFRKIVGKDEDSPNWKGKNVRMGGLHRWVELHLGKTKKCDFCGVEDKKIVYDWANKSGEYKRILTDWLRLCRKCHQIYDDNSMKRKKTLMKRYNWKFK
jgi:hypothetical protein